jgi:hypothetical protein
LGVGAAGVTGAGVGVGGGGKDGGRGHPIKASAHSSAPPPRQKVPQRTGYRFAAGAMSVMMVRTAPMTLSADISPAGMNLPPPISFGTN